MVDQWNERPRQQIPNIDVVGKRFDARPQPKHASWLSLGLLWSSFGNKEKVQVWKSAEGKAAVHIGLADSQCSIIFKYFGSDSCLKRHAFQVFCKCLRVVGNVESWIVWIFDDSCRSARAPDSRLQGFSTIGGWGSSTGWRGIAHCSSKACKSLVHVVVGSVEWVRKASRLFGICIWQFCFVRLRLCWNQSLKDFDGSPSHDNIQADQSYRERQIRFLLFPSFRCVGQDFRVEYLESYGLDTKGPRALTRVLARTLASLFFWLTARCRSIALFHTFCSSHSWGREPRVAEISLLPNRRWAGGSREGMNWRCQCISICYVYDMIWVW